MKIVRRYFDEDEWEDVDERIARKILARGVLDVDIVLEDIAAGRSVFSIAAEYKRVPDEALRQQEEGAA